MHSLACSKLLGSTLRSSSLFLVDGIAILRIRNNPSRSHSPLQFHSSIHPFPLQSLAWQSRKTPLKHLDFFPSLSLPPPPPFPPLLFIKCDEISRCVAVGAIFLIYAYFKPPCYHIVWYKW